MFRDMKDRREPPELTSDLDYWTVTLRDGGTVIIRAHTVGEEDGYLSFVALMAGVPAYEYELVRLPIGSVADYEGGWSTPRNTQDAAQDGERS
jgi:hypothetical protein